MFWGSWFIDPQQKTEKEPRMEPEKDSYEILFNDFGGGQLGPGRSLLLAGEVEVNAFAQGAPQRFTKCRDRFRERGDLGHLSFCGPTSHSSVTYLSVCLKRVKICPSYVYCLLPKSIFCGADIGSTIALDQCFPTFWCLRSLQEKTKFAPPSGETIAICFKI